MGTLEYLKYRDNLLKRLLNTTDVTILKRVEKAFNNNENDDPFNELPTELQQMLLQSEEDIKENRFVSHEEVMNSFIK
jgi:hypothetical protein